MGARDHSQQERRVTRAHAHSHGESYMYLSVGSQAISGSVQFPSKELNSLLDLDLPITSETRDRPLNGQVEPVEAFIARSVAMHIDGEEVGLSFGGSRIIAPHAGAFLVTDFEVEKPFERPFATAIDFSGVFASIPDLTALLIFLNAAGLGRFISVREERRHLDPSSPVGEAVFERPSPVEDLSAVLQRGRRSLAIRVGRLRGS